MTDYAHAGVYPPDDWPNQRDRLTPGATVGIYNYGTLVLATLWADRDRAVEVANPITLDADGNNEAFFADPGPYDARRIEDGDIGPPVRIDVAVDPADAVEEPSGAEADYLGEAADEAAMLAFAPAAVGDWAIRTDLDSEWRIVSGDGSDIGDWVETPYPVVSVNARRGAVIGLAEAADVDIAIGAALASALAAVADEQERAEAAEADARTSEIVSIDLLTILTWGLIPAAGIANALIRRELSWSFIPDEDVEIKFTLSAPLGTATPLQITHLSLIDQIAVAAGQTLLQAQMLDLKTPSSSGVTGPADFNQASSARRFCRAGVLQSVAAYAWFTGTAPAAGSILCNGPGAAGNSPTSTLRIERV